MSDDYQQNTPASSGRHAQAQSNLRSKAKSGSQQEVRSQAKSDVQSEEHAQTKSNVQSQARSQAQHGSHSRAQSQAQSASQQQARARSQAQSASQHQARSQSQAQSASQQQARSQSQARSASQQQPRARSQAQSASQHQARSQSQARPASQQQARSQGRGSAGAPLVPPVQTSAFRPAHVGSGRDAVGAGLGGAGDGKGTGNHSGRQSNMSEQKNNKKKGGLWRVVFVMALSVFVIALVALGAIGFSYWQGQNTYESLAEQAFSVPEDIEGETLADLTVDWDALRAINPDIVGWLYIPDTIINYPVVHSGDDSTYLTRDFYGNVGGSWLPTYGTVFLSGDNAPDFSDANNIIYGHNLLNGCMFASLAGFADEAQFNSHRRVYLLTPQRNYRLTSLSLVHCFATDPIVQTTFATPEEYTTYVQTQIGASVVTPNPPAASATEVTKSFAFSTCDSQNSSMRFVLFCGVTEEADLGVDGANGVAEGSTDMVDPETGEVIGDAAEALK